MNRNTESHFATIPQINISRSKFERPYDLKTTFSTGDLIPIFCDVTVMPGDSIKMRMAEIVRMMTPIAPVMDNAYMDTYFFAIPYRLLWENFKRFYGENDTAPWTQTGSYTIPQIKAPTAGWKKGSLADYFGYPTEVGKYEASAIPFRAYVKVYNDWFRSENVNNPLYLTLGDATITGTDKTTLGASYDPIVDTEKGAAPVKVSKSFDVFTAALPEPQKGPDVPLPLGEWAPVTTRTDLTTRTGTQPTLKWQTTTGTNPGNHLIGMQDSVGNTVESQSTFTTTNNYLVPANLWTDLSVATGSSINQLRQAYAIQKYYENCARGGTRYIESIKAHFSVTSSDARMQRAEYIGGKRVPINVSQIIQTEATAAGITPMGTTGAYSVTSDRNDDLFTWSAEEHCVVLGLAVVRTEHSYQQGLNRQFSMKELFDFYTPELANLGEVGILNKELYMVEPGTTGEKNEEAFGYQEAWYWYRYFPNMITGEMRSNYAQSLDIWHYGDYYNALPTLSTDWLNETDVNVGRTLAVQNHDQFFGDFYFNPIYTRPMPLYSVPGLTGHY